VGTGVGTGVGAGVAVGLGVGVAVGVGVGAGVAVGVGIGVGDAVGAGVGEGAGRRYRHQWLRTEKPPPPPARAASFAAPEAASGWGWPQLAVNSRGTIASVRAIAGIGRCRDTACPGIRGSFLQRSAANA
jgi:hypothetical protein